MLIFDFVGEMIGEMVGGVFFDGIKGAFSRLFRGKKASKYHSNHPYYSLRKQSIKFITAQKRILLWETNIGHIHEVLKQKAVNNSDRKTFTELKLRSLHDKTIIVPPSHISSETFHQVIQILYRAGINAVGLVETTRAAYTTYGDPNSDCLIGQTNKGDSFFILPSESFFDKQYLRISKHIPAIEGYDVATIKAASH